MRISDEQRIIFVEEILAEFTTRTDGVVFTIFADTTRRVIRLSVANGIESTSFGVSVTFAQTTRIRLADASRTPGTIVVQISTTFAVQPFGVMCTVASTVDLARTTGR
jgi:hypothetical protein